MKKLLLFILAFFAVVIGHAKEWTADNIPMAHLEDRTRYVCDPENLMSPADRDTADVYLRRLETQCGIFLLQRLTHRFHKIADEVSD
jgi:uncharacterized protein